MPNKVLHIGAHRTGTSSLQRFLQENKELLAAQQVGFLSPPASRMGSTLANVAATADRWSGEGTMKVLISEENLLGTMENNFDEEALYPNAKYNLLKLQSIFRPDIVMMSIRELGDYWNSAAFFSFSRGGIGFPSKEKVATLAQNPRSWQHVVEDVTSVFPNAKIIIREFNYFTDNPKKNLRLASGWPEWGDAKLNRRAHNQRPSHDVIVSKLLEQKDFNSLSRLGTRDGSELFSRVQRLELYERYQNDLKHIRRRFGSSFFEPKEGFVVKGLKANVWPSENTDTQRKTVFLHIGKTGGTFIKSLHQREKLKRSDLVLGDHGDTLLSSIKNFGQSRKLAFFFRAPEERFVSGFNSRLRQGRPTFDVIWTTAEAVAFNFFRTPNALAEALYSKDEHQKSAARFAMSSIFHLKHNYSYFLHSADAVRYEASIKNIEVCCETNQIDRHLDKILVQLGISLREKSSMNKNSSPDSTATALSPGAKDNLHRFWSREYEIYDACRSVAKDLGFDN